VRMIAPGYGAAPILQQSIDLSMCIHGERMRTRQTYRAVQARSVDG
jgi:hypothetical protein